MLNKMKLFLIKNLMLLTFFVLLEINFFVVFYLMNLEFEAFYIATKISVLFLFVYLLISYSNFSIQLKYKDQIKELEEINKYLTNKNKEERTDLEDYFMLWIHQIKTPITASKLIANNNVDNEDFLKIRRELLLIDDYTNMALNYLKLTNFNSDMYITEVSLDNVIKDNLKKYSSLFIAKKISLDYEKIDKIVVTDEKWFSILFEQIFSNAIKYTKNGKISILFNEDENYLEIKDTGIGISESDIPKIFDKGYSGFNGKLNEKSTGLGLFLVKRISEKLNLEINVESKINQGTSFKIKFSKRG